MLVVVLCCLIVLLLLLLFMQNLRQKRNNRMQSTAQERQHKPDQQRVTYLEPRVTAEQTVTQAEVVEQPVIDAPVSQAESADDVLGLSATRTQADSSPSLPSQQPSAELGAAMQEQSVAKLSGDELIVLYLKASVDKPYAGYELLQAVLSSGLRYGENQVFHRYQSTTERTKVLFSLASAVEPSTFDLPRMGGYSTKALCFYFKLKDPQDPMAAFEAMLHTAGQLSEDLGGKVLDEKRELLTKETVRDLCLRIRRYEKTISNLDLFADTLVD